MRRREFITLVGGAAAAWPLAASAQQPAMPVIGFLSGSGSPADRLRFLTAFRQGVREAGYVEGQSVAIEYRWAQDQYDRLPDLAASLNRPGGNVTGVSFVNAALGAKQLGLLHELQPGAVRVGVLVEPNFPLTESFVSDVQAAASSVRKQVEVLEAPTGRDIDTV